MGTENNLNDLRVASFSCYLKPIEDVNMFDASDHKFSDMAVLDLHTLNPNTFTARTPSIALETSSFSNNQGALLQRKPSGRASSKSWFHGPCSTRKSVYVRQSIKPGEHFEFPVLNPALEIFKSEEKVEELPRMSIELFGSNTIINKGDMATNLVRKMSILTWDAIPKSKETVMCDDMASEASSDLFEIKNISRTGWKPIESNYATSPTTQYVPSEASIEWSVVTASAAEFSSTFSGYDEKHAVYNTRSKPKTEKAKKPQKTRTNGLLGCNSIKSVQVVEPVSYRCIDKPKH